jgi:mRNA interferase HigB
MRIVNRSTIGSWSARHGDAFAPLTYWYRVSSRATWSCFEDVRKDFPAADHIPTKATKDLRVVFNIGGNSYRLVVHIQMAMKTIYLKDFLTHAEYDKVDLKAKKYD